MFESRLINTRIQATVTAKSTMAKDGINAQASASLRNQWRAALRLSIALAVVCLFAAPAWAVSFLTINTLADTATGSLTTCTTGGVCSLRDAITAANADNADDIIDLTGLVGTIMLTSPLPAITADMVFRGPGIPIDELAGPYGLNLLTVSGNNLYPVFNIASGHVIIYGLVFANGYNSANGGGIYVGSSGKLELLLCTISGSYARYGGGIANYGTLIIDNSTISGNSTSNVGAGGGIYNAPSSKLQVTESTFTGNSSPLTNGGAIFIDAGSTVKLTNITISGNSANTDGGLHIANGTNANPTTVTLNNSILTGNTNDDCASCTTTPSAAFSFTNNDSYIGGISGGTAPTLGPLQWNGGPTQTMMPLPGSSAICAGSTAFISTAFGDQRLFSLPSGDCSTGKLDQGAVQSMYLTVNSTADTATGTLSSCTGGGGVCTLRDAIHVAMNDTGTSANNLRNDGDILFDSTVFGTTQKTITLGSSLDTINSALNIQGPGASLLTVDGNGSSGSGVTNSILYMISSPSSGPHSSASVNVSGLTLTNGIANSTTQEGGAIYNDGALSVVNSVISGSGISGSGRGGGIFNDSYAMMLLTGSTVSGNSAADGAGIYNNIFGMMLVMDSTISGNSVPYGGGDGGGIYNGSPLQLINTTLSGNSASDGGGIYNTGKRAVLTVTDCTIFGNTAKNDDSASFGGGGGIDNYNDGSDGNGLITVTNSIIAGNSSYGSDDLETCTSATPNCTLAVTDQYDLIDTVAHTTASGAYNIALAPLALNGPLATTQTMMPGPGSVAIQGGSAAEVPVSLTTDQRGFPRLTGGKMDIGAVQTNYTISFSTQPTDTPLGQLLATTPVVLVTETNTSTSATDKVNGVPVTLTYTGPMNGITGTLTETTDVNGHATFSGLTGSTLGTYTFTVAGSLAATGTAVTSNTFDVYGTITHFVFSTPATAIDGVSFNFTITAEDSNGNIAAGYNGTANLTGVGGTAVLPGSVTFSHGLSGTLSATLTTVGTMYISAYDPVYVIQTTSGPIVVSVESPASINISGGNNQSAFVTTAFGASLQATVRDQNGNLFPGASVTFTAPVIGTSAVFSNLTNTITVTTNSSGVARSGTITANGIGGSYSVSATVNALNATFSLTNTTISPIPVTRLTDDATGVISNCTDPTLNATSCSLRDAIATANAEGAAMATPPVINFAPSLGLSASTPGTYSVITGNTLIINANMKIQGPGANLLSISGENSDMVFSVTNTTASISGMTIANGSTSANGGGILNSGTLTVSNCAFSGNSASSFGGGIINSNVLTVSNSTFNGNSAGNGGGIYNDNGTLTVSNSTFSGNSVGVGGHGGAIYENLGTATVTNSTFSGNGTGSNPGFYIDDGNLTTANCVMNESVMLNGNSAHYNSSHDLTFGFNLAPLGNYGGPTQTMPPLPGSVAICEGSASIAAAAGLTTDQRGNPRPTSVYGASCVDAGAVQTAYSLGFIQSPSATQQPGVMFTPTATVQLYDNNSIINLPGAPISVALNSGTLAGTANPYTTGSTGLATFGGLSATTVTTLTNDYLTASAAAGPYTITANSSNFNIIVIILSPTSLPAAQIGVPYSQQITASGGTGPYSYSVGSGLPAGLSLSSTGLLSGKPTAGGPTFSFTITATDSLGNTGSQAFTLAVNAPTISVSPATLASGTYGTSYTQSVSASGGTAPYNYALANGSSLPPGLTLNSSSGAITGTPSQARATAYTFTIIATDSSTGTGPYTGSQLISLTINQANAAITVTGYSVAYDGTAHTSLGTATGAGGANLAADLTLSSTTHTSAGTYASDSWSFTDPNGNYANASGTVNDKINQASATISVTGYSVAYDGTAHTVTGTATGVGGVNLAADLTLSGTTHTSAGTYSTDTWSFNDPNGNYASASGSVSDKISKATPTVTLTLTSGGNPVFAQTPITFTAAVGFASGSGSGGPTGTVTFQDGGVALSSCTGVALGAYSSTTGTATATCTISTLAVGSNNITALYNGDGNFLSATSSALTEAVVDFTINVQNVTLTQLPGSAGQFTFIISPVSPATTFPSVITFSISGLPAGATYSFSPPSVGPCSSSCTTTVTLNIQTQQTASAAQPEAGGHLASRLAPFSLALLLLPFASRLRRSGKRFSRMLSILLLFAASMAAIAGLSGCGSTIGFFGQAQQSYTVTVTGTSGALSHTSTITLTVE